MSVSGEGFMVRHMHAAGGSLYHSEDDCPEAQAIPSELREEGSGELPKCPVCQHLSRHKAARRRGPVFMTH
jgi:hypothetical protein